MADLLAEALKRIAALPADAIKQIKEAWRQADAALKESLRAVPYSENIEPCLPFLRTHGLNRFDPVEAQLDAHCDDEKCRAALEKLGLWITEGILNDQGLSMAWAALPEVSRRLSTSQDVRTGMLFEGKPDERKIRSNESPKDRGLTSKKAPAAEDWPDGPWLQWLTPKRSRKTRSGKTSRRRYWAPALLVRYREKPASREIASFHARYGAFEENAPDHLWFLLRFPENRTKVRAMLLQVLEQQVDSCSARRRSMPRALTTAPEASPHGSAAADAEGALEIAPGGDMPAAHAATNPAGFEKEQEKTSEEWLSLNKTAKRFNLTTRHLRRLIKPDEDGRVMVESKIEKRTRLINTKSLSEYRLTKGHPSH